MDFDKMYRGVEVAFPEILDEDVEKVQGVNVAIVTTAGKDREAESLLTLFGFSFLKEINEHEK